MQPGLAGLVERVLEDLAGQALHLDVHLQGGDAFFGARDLEVHVAEVILVAEDVGEHGDLVADLHEAHGDARNGCLDRHARVHHGHGAAADRSHRGRPVGLHDVGDDTNGVRELLERGQHGLERALGQCTVAGLAAGGAAHGANFAGAVRGEVVVQQEVTAYVAAQGVESLGVVLGAQRAGRPGLGLTTLEERRAVRAGVRVRLHPKRADIASATTVEALARVDDHVAHGFLLDLGEARGDVVALLGVRGEELVFGLGLDRRDRLVALVLGGDLERLFELRLRKLHDRGLKGFVDLGRDVLALGLAGDFA